MLPAIAIIVIVLLLILANALYVAAEFSAVRARRTRVAQMADAGNGLAEKLLPILKDKKRLNTYIAATQVGITVSSLILGAYAQRELVPLLIPFLSRTGLQPEAMSLGVSALIVLVILTLFHALVGEMLPKAIAVQFPEAVALSVILPIHWSTFVFRPFIWLYNHSSRLVLRLLRVRTEPPSPYARPASEIELMVTDSHEGGLIDDKERQMLRNAFRMRELVARQVMVPRTRMVTASIGCTIAEVLNVAIENGFSRIPVYRDSIDNIIGFVHIKDLFRQHLRGEENIRAILRDVLYVPETMPIIDLWEALNQTRMYLVIVFDEYGGTEGLITFEDLIEEIFGELQDEFDEHEMALISHDKEGRTHLRADLLVTDINEYLNLDLPYEEADTLGGLVFGRLGRHPQVNDEVDINGLLIRVEGIADLGIAEISFKLPSTGSVNVGEWEVSNNE